MTKFIKVTVVLAGLAAWSQVPQVRPALGQAQATVGAWIARPTAGPSATTIKTELTGIENRLAQIKSEADELEATARSSQQAADRLGELLSKTKGDIVVVQADGQTSEFAREELQLEQAVFIVSGAAAKIEQSALADETGKLREKHRELTAQARRETAKAITSVLREMPRIEGKSRANEKR